MPSFIPGFVMTAFSFSLALHGLPFGRSHASI
jgi:hypothetical protein